MLSSQTKDEVMDEVMDAAMVKLRTALGGAVSLQAVLEAEEAIILEAISKVGFWKKKTQCVFLFFVFLCSHIFISDPPNLGTLKRPLKSYVATLMETSPRRWRSSVRSPA